MSVRTEKAIRCGWPVLSGRARFDHVRKIAQTKPAIVSFTRKSQEKSICNAVFCQVLLACMRPAH
jgi:hypothetical protein